MARHEDKKAATIKKRQDKDKAALLEILRKSPVVHIACLRVGVGRATYYRWIHEDERFAKDTNDALEHGVELVSDMAESHIIKSVVEGNLASGKYWLENHRKKYRKPKKPAPSEDVGYRLRVDI